ncbi:MAG: hypothetical protein KC656_27570, partial [Myxococcales bacterium]|nr:hypothetical protein [Myxococcales bacterium]
SVTIDLAHDPASTDIDFALYDAVGGYIDGVGTGNAVETLTWENPTNAAVPVVLDVFPYGAGGCTPYTVEVTETPLACTDDLLEDNDTPGTATLLSSADAFSAVASPGDDDHFTVSVAPGEEVAFRLREDAADDLDVELRAAGVLVDSESTGRSYALFYSNTGTTYVDVVLSVSSVSCIDYDLVVDVYDLACVDLWEPNGDDGAAPEIYAGNLQAIAAPHEIDSYTLWVETGDLVDLWIPTTAGQIGLAIYDELGTLLDSDQGFGASLLWTNASGPRYVYVLVWELEGLCTSYDLAVSITAGSCPIDFWEPNDDSLNAPFLFSDTGLYAGPADEDWFTMSVPADSRGVAWVVPDDTSGFYLDLYDAAGGYISSDSGVAPIAVSTTTSGLPAADFSLVATSSICTAYDIGVDTFGCTEDDAWDFGLDQNDTALTAQPLTSGIGLLATGTDRDFWDLGEVAPGETVDVVVSFIHRAGDIDATLTLGLDVDPSGGTSDTEVMTLTNLGLTTEHAILEVFHYNGSGAACRVNRYGFDSQIQ